MASILLVDDNDSFLWAMRRFLKLAGHAIHEAGSGTEALEKVASIDVDLVITDLNMPGLDGIGMIRELKRQGSPAPIIAVSGEVASEPSFSLEAARRCGADLVLLKPFPPEVLVTAMAQLLERRAAKPPAELASVGGG